MWRDGACENCFASFFRAFLFLGGKATLALFLPIVLDNLVRSVLKLTMTSRPVGRFWKPKLFDACILGNFVALLALFSMSLFMEFQWLGVDVDAENNMR